MKEIEILIEIKSDKVEVLKALKNFEFQGIKKTLDIYFYDPLRDNLKPMGGGRLHASFRIRQKDGKNFIAYKVDHFENGEWSHSDEYETEIGEFDVMVNIVEKLGFKELVRVENEKHTFRVDDYEIVFEEVRDLGLFLEVEKMTEVEDKKVKDTKEMIRTFLKTLNIEFGLEQNAGKPELMLRTLEESKKE